MTFRRSDKSQLAVLVQHYGIASVVKELVADQAIQAAFYAEIGSTGLAKGYARTASVLEGAAKALALNSWAYAET